MDTLLLQEVVAEAAQGEQSGCRENVTPTAAEEGESGDESDLLTEGRDRAGLRSSANRGNRFHWSAGMLKQGSASRAQRERDLSAFGFLISRSARHGHAAQVQELLEVQGVPIPGRHPILQRKPRIPGHLGRSQVRREAKEMDGVLSILHSPVEVEEQLLPSLQMHPVPREEAG